MKTKLRSTIEYLKSCQAARAQGYPVAYTTDPAWLVDMAINRKAQWPDDPSHARGSCMPVNGRYPAKASGDAYRHLRLRAQEINTPRLRVYLHSLGEWRDYLLQRLPNRFVSPEEV